jgi:hypothetical protein
VANKPVVKTELGWPTGDQPGDLRFQHLPSEAIHRAIVQVLSPTFPPARASNVILRSLVPSDEIAGRYCLTTPEGKWFVRVSMWLGNPVLEKSLLDYLTTQQVMVNPFLVAGLTLNWSGRTYRVDIRPLVEGRHFNGSSSDLRHLASTVATCHRALLTFPQSDVIRASAVSRYNHFAEVHDLIALTVKRSDFSIFAEHQEWAVEHRQWLVQMVEQYTPHFDRYPGAQCLHGQIHPGNVLFRSSDQAAVLVDFEEAIYTFAPPAFDLAYLVQRFCLRDNPTPDIRQQRLDTMSAHYGPLPPLADMMRQLAWYSMAAIVECRVYQGITVPLAEYDKFVRLEQQARTLVGVV